MTYEEQSDEMVNMFKVELLYELKHRELLSTIIRMATNQAIKHVDGLIILNDELSKKATFITARNPFLEKNITLKSIKNILEERIKKNNHENN